MSLPKQYVCIDCGLPTLQRTRCEDCAQKRGGFAAGFRPGPRQPTYDMTRWRRLSARLRRDHVAQNGWWCPGWKRPAHRSRDLTVDHIVALVDGGPALDPGNCRVLCRSCNGRAGLSVIARRRHRSPEGGGD